MQRVGANTRICSGWAMDQRDLGETSIWEAAFLYLVSNRHRVGTVESTDSVEHDAQRWSASVVRRVPTILRVAVSTGLRVVTK